MTLLLERSLIRVLLGVVLLGNGVNLLILSVGGPVARRWSGSPAPGAMSDPLPQAMVLTAIVITFGFTAFLLAISYRSWYLTGDDEVPDDLEDRQIVRRAARNEVATADLGGEGAGCRPGAGRRRPAPPPAPHARTEGAAR